MPGIDVLVRRIQSVHRTVFKLGLFFKIFRPGRCRLSTGCVVVHVGIAGTIPVVLNVRRGLFQAGKRIENDGIVFEALATLGGDNG